MSPRWATVAGYDLYFYAAERHQRPHVDVRGPDGRATLDIRTGEVLAGRLPARVLRAVKTVLDAHRTRALEAFQAALEHRPFDSLETLEDDDD
jgi:hypothetical protein